MQMGSGEAEGPDSPSPVVKLLGVFAKQGLIFHAGYSAEAPKTGVESTRMGKATRTPYIFVTTHDSRPVY